MKREIKFRAWSKSQRYMDFPTSITIGDGGHVEGVRGYGGEYPYADIELMQYTGLHDKNGREIYEGDIVRSIPKRQHEKSLVGTVYYGRVDPSFTIHYKDGHDFRLYSSGEYRAYEVIGNIYENPELLEAEK